MFEELIISDSYYLSSEVQHNECTTGLFDKVM